MADELEERWLSAAAPVTKYNVSAASGTYQAAAADQYKLHVMTSSQNVRLERGTGASVTASSGTLWGAFQPYYFIPKQSEESIGWSAVSGNSISVTIAVVEN